MFLPSITLSFLKKIAENVVIFSEKDEFGKLTATPAKAVKRYVTFKWMCWKQGKNIIVFRDLKSIFFLVKWMAQKEKWTNQTLDLGIISFLKEVKFHSPNALNQAFGSDLCMTREESLAHGLSPIQLSGRRRSICQGTETWLKMN